MRRFLHLSHPKSDLSDFGIFKWRSRVNPTSLGRGSEFPGDGSSFPVVDKALISLALMRMEDDGWS
jgi:hypothetical protein